VKTRRPSERDLPSSLVEGACYANFSVGYLMFIESCYLDDVVWWLYRPYDEMTRHETSSWSVLSVVLASDVSKVGKLSPEVVRIGPSLDGHRAIFDSIWSRLSDSRKGVL